MWMRCECVYLWNGKSVCVCVFEKSNLSPPANLHICTLAPMLLSRSRRRRRRRRSIFIRIWAQLPSTLELPLHFDSKRRRIHFSSSAAAAAAACISQLVSLAQLIFVYRLPFDLHCMRVCLCGSGWAASVCVSRLNDNWKLENRQSTPTSKYPLVPENGLLANGITVQTTRKRQ